MNTTTFVRWCLVIGTVLIIVMGGWYVAAHRAALFGGHAAPSKVYHIGIISGRNQYYSNVSGFKTQMDALGYKVGKNIVYEEVKTNDSNENLHIVREAAQKYADEHVDLVFVFPTFSTVEALKVTEPAHIPLVYSHASLEVAATRAILAREGVNATGVARTSNVTQLRLTVLHKMLPQAKRIVVPYDATNISLPAQIKALTALAKEYHVTIIELKARDTAELKKVFGEYVKKNGYDFDAVLEIPDPLMTVNENHMFMAQSLEAKKIPFAGGFTTKDGYGSLFDYSSDELQMGMQAAVMADKILKGTSASAIAPEEGKAFLTLNLREATRLGITVDDDLISQATKVIK